MKSNAFWRKRYVTTVASPRSNCLNDLYHHKDLWELAVEGDIHAVVSVLQMRVPWMPNRRKRSWGERRGASPPTPHPLSPAASRHYTSFAERDRIPLFLVYWGDSLNTSVWFSKLSPQPWGWVIQASSSQEVSQCSRFIYYWLSWKQSSSYGVDMVAQGAHPHHSWAWIESAPIVQRVMSVL